VVIAAVKGAARLAGRELHHSLPKFLAGEVNQLLTSLPTSVHRELHSLLAASLKNAGFPLPVGGVTGSAAAWRAYFIQNPGMQEKALNVLLDVTATIDKKYGMDITWDLFQNLVLANYTVL
jgi:hypothetical protein